MPRIVSDDIVNGTPEYVDIGYEELPLMLVAEMARRGDPDAQAWLEAHPPEPDEPGLSSAT